MKKRPRQIYLVSHQRPVKGGTATETVNKAYLTEHGADLASRGFSGVEVWVGEITNWKQIWPAGEPR